MKDYKSVETFYVLVLVMECNFDSLKPLNLFSSESESDLKVEMSFWSLQIAQNTNEFFVKDFCPSLLKEVK